LLKVVHDQQHIDASLWNAAHVKNRLPYNVAGYITSEGTAGGDA